MIGSAHTYHWRNSAGVLHASVRFDAGGYSTAHLQGRPDALRGLAAALHLAVDQAEQARTSHPAVEVVAS